MKNNFRPLLSTTVLARSLKLAVTTGAMMLTSTGAWAVDELTTPTGEVVVGGSASFDRPAAGQLNINQHTDRVVINWNQFNIGSGATTQFYQPGSNSLAVNRVVGANDDPTRILGTLKANGRVMVLDRNGVLFGRDAVLDVGGIIASTGDIDTSSVMSGANILQFKNFGDGSIINEGLISVKDAGLAAFVGKHVANSGVINAKLGKVVLAAGSTNATVDLYGDGLVEFALDGEKTKVLAENSGTINAEGGTVALSASAAKDVVDNVINMDGVINVSSVTVKGGKIILGGGKSGNVKVSGTLVASGEQGGGDVTVTGKNVEVTGNIINNAGATGNGGNTLIYGDDYAVFNGQIFGRGGSVSGNGGLAEVSAGKGVGYYGYTDLSAANGEAGTLTIDPEFLTISNAAYSGDWMYFLSLGILGEVNVNDQAIANALRNNHVKLWATDTLSVTEDIDVSTWEQKNYVFNFGACFFGCAAPSTFGVTTKDLTLAAPTINISHDIILGEGRLLIQDVGPGDSLLGYGIINAPVAGINVDVVNLDGRIYKRSTPFGALSEAGDDQIDSQAHTVNVLSDAARIQQGIYLANDEAQGIVNVAAGTYTGPAIHISKNVNLRGANADIAGTGARGAESIIDPNSPGLYLDAGASGSIINGMLITGADDHGIHVEGASNVSLLNNVIHDIKGDGIYANVANGLIVKGNYIYDINTKGHNTGTGIHVLNTLGATIGGVGADANVIEDTEWDGISIDKSRDVTISWNDIDDVARTGIFIGNNSRSVEATNNFIDNAGMWGIHGEWSNNLTLIDNRITDTGYDGIRLYKVKGTLNTLNGNIINTTGQHLVAGRTGNGISLDSSLALKVYGNLIGTLGAADNIRGDGIYGYDIDGAQIYQNVITKTKSLGTGLGSGIHLVNSDLVTLGGPAFGDGNVIYNVGWDGIRVYQSSNLTAQYNVIDNVHRSGIYVGETATSKILNNDIDTVGVRYGIDVDLGADTTITGNDIDNTARHGIYVHGVKGINLINENHVDTTRGQDLQGDGIHADTVANLSILGNFVGLDSAATKIKGDGIFATKTDGVVIKSNQVENTRSIQHGVGSGIRVTHTNGATIGAAGETNIIRNTDWDGVSILRSSAVKIDWNDIDDAARTGIFIGDNSKNVEAHNNYIDNTGMWGVHGEWSNNLTLIDNRITDTGYDGIRLYKVKGTLNTLNGNIINTTGQHLVAGRTGNGISLDSSLALKVYGNLIGTLGAADNIRGDGIYGYDIDGAQIYQNVITKTKSLGTGLGSGIHLVNSDLVTLGGPAFGDGNVIYNVGWDGIRVYQSSNLTAQYNVIDNVHRSGIYVGETATSKILNNDIDTVGVRYGIDVERGSDTTVVGNDVDNTARHGIYVHSVKGANLIASNHVDTTRRQDSQGDGIHANDVTSLSILGNFVGLNSAVTRVKGDGIFVAKSNGVVIDTNEVTNFNRHGIYVQTTNAGQITANTVSKAGLGNSGLFLNATNSGLFQVGGNTFTNNNIGATFQSGLIDLTGTSNSFVGGDVGMRFDGGLVSLVDLDGAVNSLPTEAPLNYGGTIGTQTFTGQGRYVELLNGAFANTWVDGRFSSYDGFTPGTSILSPADFSLLEPMFWDWTDDNGVGRFWGIPDDDTADIPQERILNTFDPFGAAAGEVNVVLLGLPPLPGGGAPSPTNLAGFLNSLTPNAGDETGADPADIEPAAGGIEPAAGPVVTTAAATSNSSCWADATASAVAGSTTTFSFSSVVNQTTLAQETNCGNGQPQ